LGTTSLTQTLCDTVAPETRRPCLQTQACLLT
jgi:hypothetical protein